MNNVIPMKRDEVFGVVGVPPETRMIDVSKIKVPTYHGARNPFLPANEKRRSQLRKILRESGGFDYGRYDPIAVNDNGDGTFDDEDGGGRLWMAIECGLRTLKCEVHDKKRSEQVEDFVGRNRGRMPLSKSDEWIAQFGETPKGKATLKIIREQGFEIGGQRAAKNRISHFTAQFGIDLGILDLALADIKHLKWHEDKNFTNTHAAAIFAVRGLAHVDQKRFRERMRDTNPALLHMLAIKRCQDVLYLLKPQARHISWQMAHIILELCNHGAKTGRKSSFLLDSTEYPDARDIYWTKVGERAARKS